MHSKCTFPAFQRRVTERVNNPPWQHSSVWGAGCDSPRSNPLPPQEMEKADFCPHCNFLPHSFSLCLLFTPLPLPLLIFCWVFFLLSLHPNSPSGYSLTQCVCVCALMGSLFCSMCLHRKLEKGQAEVFCDRDEEASKQTMEEGDGFPELRKELCLTCNRSEAGLPHVCGCELTRRLARQETQRGPVERSSFFLQQCKRGSVLREFPVRLIQLQPAQRLTESHELHTCHWIKKTTKQTDGLNIDRCTDQVGSGLLFKRLDYLLAPIQASPPFWLDERWWMTRGSQTELFCSCKPSKIMGNKSSMRPVKENFKSTVGILLVLNKDGAVAPV